MIVRNRRCESGVREFRPYENAEAQPAFLGLVVRSAFCGTSWRFGNTGPGHARIKNIRIWVGESEVKCRNKQGIPPCHWVEMMRMMGVNSLPEFKFLGFAGTYAPGSVKRHFRIPPGRAADVLFDQSTRVKFEVCYCDIGEENCWRYTQRIGVEGRYVDDTCEERT